MKVTVHFVDGEKLDGDAEKVTLDRGGFSLVGTAGNTRSAWVGAGAIKYIVIHAAFDESYGETDPRTGTDLTKVVLHFLDGEIQHSYRDTVYSEQPGGFVLRLFDKETHQLLKALVPGSSLKGVFVVDEWDSRTESEKRSRKGPRRRPAPREAKPIEARTPITPPAPGPRAEVVAEPQPLEVADALPAPGTVLEPEREPATEAVAEPVPEPGTAPEPEAAPQPETAPPRPDVAVPHPEAAAEPEAVLIAAEDPIVAAEQLPLEPTEPAAGSSGALVIVAEAADPQVEEPGPPTSAVVLASHYDPEERRLGFVGGLTKRRKPSDALTPEQERHLALRLRISEVLGGLGPERPEDEPTD